MQCPKCARENPEDAGFCNRCGTPLSLAAAPAATTTSAGPGGAAIGGSVQGNVIINNAASDKPKPLDLPEALRRYLDNLIDTHQHLRLQGIRAGSQPLSIDLEKVYVSLTAKDKHRSAMTIERGEGRREEEGTSEDAWARGGELTIADAMNRYRRLVIIGDPGCGKTTLLAYLALTYARTLRDGAELVKDRLQLDEQDCLPILLPLRDFGRHLKDKHLNAALDGPAILLTYLRDYYAAQSIQLPENFFAQPLEEKHAVILLDGMDEVADPTLRQRVARIIEKFAVRYPGNRLVVTSRIVGYEGAARIGAEFGLAQVREFSAAEVRRFVRDWTRAVELTLAGKESETILRLADEQSGRLIQAIENNPRVADLAVNPLLLTVIALVHRYRAQLPERRSELYEEAVEVLLGQWDEAKGLEKNVVVAGRELDAGDRRSLLEPVAFWLHERARREIELDELRAVLQPSFTAMAGGDKRAGGKALNDFLRVINERSGLLIERGMGVYGFAHLTFQEYLTARALAGRKDALAYTLAKLADPWWREAILLEAGYLSTQGKQRVSDLIRAIMEADPKTEPEPCHHLLLAAESLFDVGIARVEGDLLGEVKRRLKEAADCAVPDKAQKEVRRQAILRKVAALNALSRIESGTLAASKFWTAPWGEPDWVTVPAGEFWMGSDKKTDPEAYDDEGPAHKVFVAEFEIARVPVTNAQYALFIVDIGAEHAPPPPEHWRGGKPPQGKENHPVVNVSWHEARAYCQWLSEKTGKLIRLPTEAEWEKAARGGLPSHAGGALAGAGGGGRKYPWSDQWAELKCNSDELGLGDTTPVGLFLSGASPYGCLDMSGNVWEWCNSKWGRYPYQAEDGREEIDKSDRGRVLRGGAFFFYRGDARCAYRSRRHPDLRGGNVGFRVAVSPGSQLLNP